MLTHQLKISKKCAFASTWLFLSPSAYSNILDKDETMDNVQERNNWTSKHFPAITQHVTKRSFLRAAPRLLLCNAAINTSLQQWINAQEYRTLCCLCIRLWRHTTVRRETTWGVFFVVRTKVYRRDWRFVAEDKSMWSEAIVFNWVVFRSSRLRMIVK
jgi:hypothetical protein